MKALVHAASQMTNVNISAVISHSANSEGLAWARAQGIQTEQLVYDAAGGQTRAQYDQALAEHIDRYQPDLVLLAGFMRILSDEFVRHYTGRLVNIHPSLLPLFPGLHTHQQALNAGVRVHGCSVHFVIPALDQGPIIAQAVVPVMADDTVQSLDQRVLVMEHKLYPQVMRWLAQKAVFLDEQGKVGFTEKLPLQQFYADTEYVS
ncbi:MAG TPA: phosphoribosylglycinamide formyltransferase [Advenella kashmirensis]|uniref:Phosphoribosylglycinamide formyltransferase n=2 Tax=Advenella TaxID=290425 RepID=A0A356LA31_9BURK|nr:phosphoribosylglycinamide formyltransferase [Advenella kashmirensis]